VNINGGFDGATTLSIMTLNMMTFILITLSIMTFRLITFSIMTFSIITISILAFSITLNKMAYTNIMTVSILA